jgi:hypothetical protein
MIRKRREASWELVIFGFLITVIILLGMLFRILLQKLLRPSISRRRARSSDDILSQKVCKPDAVK